MSPDNDDLSPTSFSSVPRALVEEVRKVAESRGIGMLRLAYEEAITQLCDDIDAGLRVEPWPSSRPGLARAKETVRMNADVAGRMNAAVKAQDTRKGVFFRVALVRWLARHGVEFTL